MGYSGLIHRRGLKVSGSGYRSGSREMALKKHVRIFYTVQDTGELTIPKDVWYYPWECDSRCTHRPESDSGECRWGLAGAIECTRE